MRPRAIRPEMTPRLCGCRKQGKTCGAKCDGMIKPLKNDNLRTFLRRKFCCPYCPVLREQKIGYHQRPAKHEIPAKPSALDLYLRGQRP